MKSSDSRGALDPFLRAISYHDSHRDLEAGRPGGRWNLMRIVSPMSEGAESVVPIPRLHHAAPAPPADPVRHGPAHTFGFVETKASF
jgi:hypothetical protein